MTKAIRRKGKPVPVSDGAIYRIISDDINGTLDMISTMSDSDLYDFCLSQIEQYNHYELDALYPKLAGGGELTKAERAALEGFCVLANSGMEFYREKKDV